MFQLFPAATFGLGVWQIKRKIWKEQLIAELKLQMSKEPIDLPDKYEAIDMHSYEIYQITKFVSFCISLRSLNDMEYQSVRVRGRFLHDKEMYLGPRSLIEPSDKKKGVLTLAPKSGYLVITPFQLEGREYANHFQILISIFSINF